MGASPRRAAQADQNALLSLALDQNRGANPQQPGLLPLLDQHGRGMRHFLIGTQDDLLPDQFGGEKTLRLVGKEVFGVERRRLGKPPEDQPRQQIEIPAALRGNRHELLEAVELSPAVDQRQQRFFCREQVDLIQDQQRRSLELLHQIERGAVVATNAAVESASNSTR